MIVPYALAALLSACAPSVHPQTMAAVVAVESSGDPWAIGDNDTRRSYHPASYADAVALAYDLLGKGHSVDLGIAQVNSMHLAEYGTTPEAMLRPCRNLRVASHILYKQWRAAEAAFGPTRQALDRAVGAYNSGNLYAGADYRNRVVDAALSLTFAPPPYRAQAAPVSRAVPIRQAARRGPPADPPADGGSDVPLR